MLTITKGNLHCWDMLSTIPYKSNMPNLAITKFNTITILHVTKQTQLIITYTFLPHMYALVCTKTHNTQQW